MIGMGRETCRRQAHPSPNSFQKKKKSGSFFTVQLPDLYFISVTDLLIQHHFQVLTPKDRILMDFIESGKSIQNIAEERELSRKVVRNIIRNTKNQIVHLNLPYFDGATDENVHRGKASSMETLQRSGIFWSGSISMVFRMMDGISEKQKLF